MTLEGWVPSYIYDYETKSYVRQGRTLVRNGKAVRFIADNEGEQDDDDQS